MKHFYNSLRIAGAVMIASAFYPVVAVGHIYLGFPDNVNSGYPPGITPGIPVPLKNVDVTVAVKKQNETGVFTYDYSVMNKSLHNQQIYQFLIDLTQKISGGVLATPAEYKSTCNEGVNKLSSLELTKTLTVPAVVYRPEGEHLDQNGLKKYNWSCGINNSGRVHWSARVTERYIHGNQIRIVPAKDGYPEGKTYEVKEFVIEYFLIQPNERQEGFKIVSYGLPGIRSFDVEQMIDIGWDDVPDGMKSIENLHYNLNFHGYTIGPVAPPSDFRPQKFIGYLNSIIDKAIQIGWIDKENKSLSPIRKMLDNIEHDIEDKTKSISTLSELEGLLGSKGCINTSTQDCMTMHSSEQQLYIILLYNIAYLKSNI